MTSDIPQEAIDAKTPYHRYFQYHLTPSKSPLPYFISSLSFYDYWCTIIQPPKSHQGFAGNARPFKFHTRAYVGELETIDQTWFYLYLYIVFCIFNIRCASFSDVHSPWFPSEMADSWKFLCAITVYHHHLIRCIDTLSFFLQVMSFSFSLYNLRHRGSWWCLQLWCRSLQNSVSV